MIGYINNLFLESPHTFILRSAKTKEYLNSQEYKEYQVLAAKNDEASSAVYEANKAFEEQEDKLSALYKSAEKIAKVREQSLSSSEKGRYTFLSSKISRVMQPFGWSVDLSDVELPGPRRNVYNPLRGKYF